MQILVIFQEIIIQEKLVDENEEQELKKVRFRLNFTECSTKFSKRLLKNSIQLNILSRLCFTTTENFMKKYKQNIDKLNEAYKNKHVLLKFKFIKNQYYIIKFSNKYKVII